MASIRQAAQNVINEARDGIAWIAVWKEGKSWDAMAFWPEYDESTDSFIFDDEWRLELLRGILAADEHAAFVNGWWNNLGDPETMTRDSLAGALRWQYGLGHSRLADVLQNCEK